MNKMPDEILRKAKEIASRPYIIQTEVDETTEGEPIFVAYNPELPGCMAQGETIEDAISNLEDARFEYILSLLEDNLEVPTPKVYMSSSTTSVVAGGSFYSWTQFTGNASQPGESAQSGRRTEVHLVFPA